MKSLQKKIRTPPAEHCASASGRITRRAEPVARSHGKSCPYVFALVLFAMLSLLFPTALSAQSAGEITYMLVLPRTMPVTEAVRAAEARVGSELFSDESNWERYYSSLRNGFNQGLAEGYAARVPRTDVRRRQWSMPKPAIDRSHGARTEVRA